MAKFKIPENPPAVNKTVRFPSNIVEEVEQAIQGKDCTFFRLCDCCCSGGIRGAG